MSWEVLNSVLTHNSAVGHGGEVVGGGPAAGLVFAPPVELVALECLEPYSLVEEGFDVAVRVARLPSSSLVSRKLSSTRMVLCATPQYLKEHGTPRHPSELARHQVLAYTLLATGESWGFDGPDGPVSVKVEPRMHSNSGDTCRVAALGHQGMILQPTFLIADDLRSGQLVEVLPQYRSLDLGIYARGQLDGELAVTLEPTQIALVGGTVDVTSGDRGTAVRLRVPA